MTTDSTQWQYFGTVPSCAGELAFEYYCSGYCAVNHLFLMGRYEQHMDATDDTLFREYVQARKRRIDELAAARARAEYKRVTLKRLEG
jgi:hypothetical protein